MSTESSAGGKELGCLFVIFVLLLGGFGAKNAYDYWRTWDRGGIEPGRSVVARDDFNCANVAIAANPQRVNPQRQLCDDDHQVPLAGALEKWKACEAVIKADFEGDFTVIRDHVDGYTETVYYPDVLDRDCGPRPDGG